MLRRTSRLLGGKAILCGNFEEDAVSRRTLAGLPSENFVGLSLDSSPGFRLPERYRIFAANQQLLQMLKSSGQPAATLLPKSFIDLASTGDDGGAGSGDLRPRLWSGKRDLMHAIGDFQSAVVESKS